MGLIDRFFPRWLPCGWCGHVSRTYMGYVVFHRGRCSEYARWRKKIAVKAERERERER